MNSHSIRSTKATHVFNDNSGDIEAVKIALGHKDSKTSYIYVKMNPGVDCFSISDILSNGKAKRTKNKKNDID